MLLLGDPSSQTSWQSTSDLDIPQPKSQRAKKVEFLSQNREVPVGLYQQVGASSWQEKTQPSGLWWKSYSQAVLLDRAGGYGVQLGPAAGCPGIP